MLISRELDYALRILRGLGDGDMHTMRALCEDELIPQKFAYKIIRKLAAADFITAVRGVGGGDGGAGGGAHGCPLGLH